MTDLTKLTTDELIELNSNVVARNGFTWKHPEHSRGTIDEDVKAELRQRLTPTGVAGDLIKDIDIAFEMADTADPAWIDLMRENEWPKLKAAVAALQQPTGDVADYLNGISYLVNQAHSKAANIRRVCGDRDESDRWKLERSRSALGQIKTWLHNVQAKFPKLRQAFTALQTSKAEAWSVAGKLADNFADDRDASYSGNKHCIWCTKEMLNDDDFCTNPECAAVRARKLEEK